MISRRVVPVAVLVVLAACGKADNRAAQGDTTAAGSAAATAARSLAAARRAQLPGELTKPISQYSGAELQALVQGLTFVGGAERSRRCKDSPGCGGTNPSQRTSVRVDAVDGVDSLSTTNIPQYGIVALRALNRGKATESMYNMKAGGQYEYYLIVLPGGVNGASATWQLQEVHKGAAPTHAGVMTGSFKGCDHPFVRGARADFKSCANATVRPASFGNLLQTDGQDPLWISCAQGCCISETGSGGGGGGGAN